MSGCHVPLSSFTELDKQFISNIKSRIVRLEEHIIFQIDENRKVSRLLEEIQDNIKKLQHEEQEFSNDWSL